MWSCFASAFALDSAPPPGEEVAVALTGAPEPTALVTSASGEPLGEVWVEATVSFAR